LGVLVWGHCWYAYVFYHSRSLTVACTTGPYCADIFNPREWGGGSEEVTNMITLEFTRIVLAIGVFAIGVELPKAYMARHWKSLFFLLVPVMTWVRHYRMYFSLLDTYQVP